MEVACQDRFQRSELGVSGSPPPAGFEAGLVDVFATGFAGASAEGVCAAMGKLSARAIATKVNTSFISIVDHTAGKGLVTERCLSPIRALGRMATQLHRPTSIDQSKVLLY